MRERTPHSFDRGHHGMHATIALIGVAALAAVAAREALAQTPPTESSPPSAFDCRATEVPGVPAADSATTVSIVCQELARVSGHQGSYGVSIRPLGKVLLLSVTRSPQGDTRTLTLGGLEEAPLAATRLAEALVLGRAIETTQRVDNLLAAEARQPYEKKSSRKFSLGVVGLTLPGRDTDTGAGYSLGLAHEAPAWAAVAELQSAKTSRHANWASLFSLSAGARRYLSRRDVAPFLGAGMEYLSISIWRDAANGTDSSEGTSLAAYLEAGVQVMRLSRGRLTARVRVHLPSSSLERQIYEWRDCREGNAYGCGGPADVRRASERVLPVTLGMSVSF